MTIALRPKHQSIFEELNERLELILSDQSPAKEHCDGRGVVICGGGAKYFSCAWVCINILRKVGCKLPVELWHLGPFEMSRTMEELIAPLNAIAVDASEIRLRHSPCLAKMELRTESKLR